MIQKNKGCYAENLAICFLQEKDYYVFKQCQTQSAVDLVAIDPHTFEIRMFDVKTQNYRKDGSYINRVPRIKGKNIEIILVDLKTKKCRIVQRKGIIWS